ncbi:hypothetical protein AVEN_2112-1 [Araneus ventricosus]|uniref:Uncharacterized protein n=1 Tax=Araneus ventricosus TaxID=182803 RepID=A0A4Y2JRR2_ARAVE|nr:hypothetical protein AVEN_2112-1 [Araneus ventricosus]
MAAFSQMLDNMHSRDCHAKPQSLNWTPLEKNCCVLKIDFRPNEIAPQSIFDSAIRLSRQLTAALMALPGIGPLRQRHHLIRNNTSYFVNVCFDIPRRT